MKNIAARITAARELKRLNKTQLARLMGVTRSAVSQWEKGKPTPDLKRIPLLSQVLDVPIEEFFVGQSAPIVQSIDARLKTLEPQLARVMLLAFNQMIDSALLSPEAPRRDDK